MAALVVCHGATLVLVEQSIAFLEPGDDAFQGARDVLHGDRLGIAASSKQCRLVDQIGQIRTGKPGRHRRDFFHFHVRVDANLPQMHVEDLHATCLIGAVDEDLPVEASRT